MRGRDCVDNFELNENMNFANRSQSGSSLLNSRLGSMCVEAVIKQLTTVTSAFVNLEITRSIPVVIFPSFGFPSDKMNSSFL